MFAKLHYIVHVISPCCEINESQMFRIIAVLCTIVLLKQKVLLLLVNDGIFKKVPYQPTNQPTNPPTNKAGSRDAIASKNWI